MSLFHLLLMFLVYDHANMMIAVSSSHIKLQEHHTGCKQGSNSLLLCSLAGRELQRWAPEASDDLTGMLLESEPAQKGKASGRWDQFAANQQLFGTATSYNEDLYTTKLDAGASGISVQEAERLAAEIQSGTTSNRHVAEERGARISDSGVGLGPLSASFVVVYTEASKSLGFLLRRLLVSFAHLEHPLCVSNGRKS